MNNRTCPDCGCLVLRTHTCPATTATVVPIRSTARLARTRNCPACGVPIYRSHHCRASALTDPPVPLDRTQFEQLRDEARAERRAEEAARAQLTLTFEDQA